MRAGRTSVGSSMASYLIRVRTLTAIATAPYVVSAELTVSSTFMYVYDFHRFRPSGLVSCLCVDRPPRVPAPSDGNVRPPYPPNRSVALPVE